MDTREQKSLYLDYNSHFWGGMYQNYETLFF